LESLQAYFEQRTAGDLEELLGRGAAEPFPGARGQDNGQVFHIDIIVQREERGKKERREREE
jgi:hypothetical protein